MELVIKDLTGGGQRIEAFTSDQLHQWAGELAALMRAAMERCDLTMAEIAAFADEYAKMIDDAGISKKMKASARWDLINALTEYYV